MKEEYVELITEAMSECEDISLLDLVWRLLVKVGGQNADAH